MSDAADAYLAHMGIEIGGELKQFGVKGMKWGVRKDRGSGSGSGGGWTEDQKKKARNVATIAVVGGAVAVGAIYASHILGQNASARASIASSAANIRSAVNKFNVDTATGLKNNADLLRNAASSRASQTAKGAKMAEDIIKKSGSVKIDPALKKFIADAPNRILQDQKGWSNSLGRSLSSIQKEDAAFMADYIKNYAPKALGA